MRAKKEDSGRKKESESWPDFSFWVRESLQAIEDCPASKPLRLAPGLYVTATPIGNLGDISLRALWVLKNADLILCEDTRVSGALLRAYGLQKPLLSCHDHNEEARAQKVLAALAEGKVLALISDAGTPTLSDPGYKLVRACRAAGYPVIPLPGASALLAALTSAGLPTNCFFFAGFLPSKQAARRKDLRELASLPATLIFYESPQRLAATLADLAKIFSPKREAAVCRELTKFFEETRRDSLPALAAFYEKAPTPKGEIVLLVGPPEEKDGASSHEGLDSLLRSALEKMTLRDAVAAVAEATGAAKSEVYKRALFLNK